MRSRLTVIVVKPGHDESLEQQRHDFETMIQEKFGGRDLPFRVMVDQRKPNLIPATRIETGGATHAAYRVMFGLRTSFTFPLVLLIGPDGIVRQRIDNFPRADKIDELEKITGLIH